MPSTPIWQPSLPSRRAARQGSNFMHEFDRISRMGSFKETRNLITRWYALKKPSNIQLTFWIHQLIIKSKEFKQDQTPKPSGVCFGKASPAMLVSRWYVGVADTPVVGFRKRRLKSCTLGQQPVDRWHLCFVSYMWGPDDAFLIYIYILKRYYINMPDDDIYEQPTKLLDEQSSKGWTLRIGVAYQTFMIDRGPPKTIPNVELNKFNWEDQLWWKHVKNISCFWTNSLIPDWVTTKGFDHSSRFMVCCPCCGPKKMLSFILFQLHIFTHRVHVNVLIDAYYSKCSQDEQQVHPNVS